MVDKERRQKQKQKKDEQWQQIGQKEKQEMVSKESKEVDRSKNRETERSFLGTFWDWVNLSFSYTIFVYRICRAAKRVFCAIRDQHRSVKKLLACHKRGVTFCFSLFSTMQRNTQAWVHWLKIHNTSPITSLLWEKQQ